jgi:hypothetical protein
MAIDLTFFVLPARRRRPPKETLARCSWPVPRHRHGADILRQEGHAADSPFCASDGGQRRPGPRIHVRPIRVVHHGPQQHARVQVRLGARVYRRVGEQVSKLIIIQPRC